MKDISKQSKKDTISRREAMSKMGLAAFSAATMMLLLNKPEKLQAQDSSTDPGPPDEW